MDNEKLTYGKDVLSRLKRSSDVLLLLDFRLPDMTAKELVEMIYASNSSIPFIIMTGYAEVKTAVELMKLGARDYLIKDSNFLDLFPDFQVICFLL